ncbi:MAG: hypothetical protein COA43_13390 [Robiginitomaculum sp.]|nr:MAG: hypothetical protein COA43_13390 [Robiginitomaculum sp.]
MKLYVATILVGTCLTLGACATGSSHTQKNMKRPQAQSQDYIAQTGKKRGRFELVDKIQFLQTDKRWARQTLGGSGESLAKYGCLVTASAMALTNLGFKTDPGDLVNRLKANKGFTKNGLLIWTGLERVTGGRTKTVFYKRKDDAVVRACLEAGYYPLVKFDLASRRTHWAVVIKETKKGFYVRDPMVASSVPIPLKSRARGIDAVRCIGMKT